MMDRVRGKQAIGVLTAVSPHNFSDEIRGEMDLPPRVTVNDLTLREGRHLEGVVLTVDEYVRITRELDDIGVPMVQLASTAPYEVEYLEAVSKLDLKMRKEVFAGGHQTWPFGRKTLFEKIDRILDFGFDPDMPFALSDDILVGTAEASGQVDKSLEYLREQEIDIAVEAVLHTKSKGGRLNVNLQDFLRCDLGYMEKMCRELVRAGVGVITLDDICGPALPQVYRYCTRRAKQAAPDTPLGIHVHNDFSLGLQGVLGALEGGAEVLDCGVNGYGERAGHADLAQLVVILEFLYGYDTGIKLERLTETSRLVADTMRQPLPKWMPIVGEKAFSSMTDWHWMFPQRPWAAASLAPEVVGNSIQPFLGEWPGRWAITTKARQLGMSIPDAKLNDVVTALREHMKWAKRPLIDEEFRSVFGQFR